MWTRPILCRVCECPASDGGVRVDQLDAAKLSEWWRLTIGTEFVANETSESKEIICNFCIWDARLLHKHAADGSNGLTECDWWSGHDTNQFIHKYYFQEGVIRQCMVTLGFDEMKTTSSISPPLTTTKSQILLADTQSDFFRVSRANISNNDENKKVKIEIYSSLNLRSELDEPKRKVPKEAKRLLKCFICDCEFPRLKAMLEHMHNFHSGRFVQCKYHGKCLKVFRTEEEKTEHIDKVHDRKRQCEFCQRTFSIDYYFTHHMRTHHKNDNLVRCSYRLCSTYFQSEEEKQKHIEIIHAAEKKWKCTFCGLFVPSRRIMRHLRNVHKSQLPNAFKCTILKCLKYFLTEADRDEHVASGHIKVALIRQEVKCIYCKKMFLDKNVLQMHIRSLHSDVKIQCTIFNCTQYFHTEKQCKAHFEQVHRKQEDKKLNRCSECDYRSMNYRTLKIHVEQLHGVKDKPCPKCSKLFGSSASLRQHLISSHSEPKICEHCNVKYVNTRYHLIRSECKKCQLILPCRKSAQLHDSICKMLKTKSTMFAQKRRFQNY